MSAARGSKLAEVIVAQLVADAAAVGAHWQYDTAKLEESHRAGNPILFPQEAEHILNPFYRLPNVGGNSFYGDQGLALVQVLAQHGPAAASDATQLAISYAQKLAEHFADGSPTYGAFPEPNISRDQYPVLKGWRCHSLKSFLSTVAEKKGALHADAAPAAIWLSAASADDQSDCLPKVAPIVTYFAQSLFAASGEITAAAERETEEKILQHIEAVVKVTQTGPNVLPASLSAARLLFQLLLNGHKHSGHSIEEVYRQVADRLKSADRPYPHPEDGQAADAILGALAAKDTPHIAFVAASGKGCGLLFNYVNALHAIVAHANLPEALLQTVLAGGDSASRGNFIGAAFAAARLDDTPLFPAEWLSHYSSLSTLRTSLDQIFQ